MNVVSFKVKSEETLTESSDRDILQSSVTKTDQIRSKQGFYKDYLQGYYDRRYTFYNILYVSWMCHE